MIILKIIGNIILAVLAGMAYRGGGAASVHARWLRQFGIGVAVTGTLLIWFGFNWWILLCLGTSWAESTYFKKKGTDAKWYNWMAVGVVFALVPIPYIIAGSHNWIGFALRSIFIIPATVLVGTFVGDVDWSEGLRGALQIVSLPLLLINA